MKRLRIRITGVVQGVGFRPFVYGFARARGLAGFVRNSSAGVELEVEGEGIDSFLEAFRSGAPPLSDIVTLETEEIPLEGDREFAILASRDDGESTCIPPDVGTCGDCLGEMKDPADRRFGYPFINCTNCGPRYSITRKVPYDRPNTTMAAFEMCPDCRREYDDPTDRRFHAQPNACDVCGPRTEFVHDDTRLFGKAAVEAAVALLRSGGTVAVKGIGGYHLAVDAENADAVSRLRERKRRSNKAFALMAPDVDCVRRFAVVSDEEEALLLSMQKPVVLLRRRENQSLPEAVAPGVPDLGFMLPYSPLHALLFPGRSSPRLLVMTSGNLSEEPVVKENGAAREKLSQLADAFLHHDREIFMRVDDSVVRRFGNQTIFIRRSRGYVPSVIPLGEDGPQVLACGADLKNTFCLTSGEAAVVSQHIGDMENHETLEFFEETLENLKAVYRITPAAMAHDLHPRYFSTRWALEQNGVEKHGIQHHYAHVGSVMAEAGLKDAVIGVALDGSGYGGDGTVWGGEFLVARRNGFERRAHFRAVPMPGGEAAARNPWQMALSYLADLHGEAAMAAAENSGMTERVGRTAVENVLKIRKNRSLSPLTSGAGRLFESVSSLLGVRDVNTFEGEAAMALEAEAAQGEGGTYPYDIHGSDPAEISFSGAVAALLKDAGSGVSCGRAAARFHNTVSAAVVEMVRRLHNETGIADVVLTGGVFQNRYLLARVIPGLSALGLRPHINARVPANDAGISLGQAFLLRSLL